MGKWTQKAVEGRLKSAKGYESFISLAKGYRPVKISGTDIFIFREEVGVSYYYCRPILDCEKAKEVNDFMILAKSFLNGILADKNDSHMYKPAPKVII